MAQFTVVAETSLRKFCMNTPYIPCEYVHVIAFRAGRAGRNMGAQLFWLAPSQGSCPFAKPLIDSLAVKVLPCYVWIQFLTTTATYKWGWNAINTHIFILLGSC